MRDYYKVLGVTETATALKIKEAYRKLALQYHPDKNPGDLVATEMLKMLNEAYETLSDPHKRKLFDQSRCVRTQETISSGNIPEEVQTLFLRFDWVGFTCKFLRNIFIGVLLFIGFSLYIGIYYKKVRDESLIQWLMIFVLPLALALRRGMYPLDVRIPSPEVDNKGGMNWIFFPLHFFFGVIAGLAYCFFLRVGIFGDLYPKKMQIILWTGIPLLLGIVGGIFQNQLWEPLLKKWFTRSWRHYS